MSLVVGSRASLASAFNGHASSSLQSPRPPSRLLCTASSSRALHGWHSDEGRLESLSSSSEGKREERNEVFYNTLDPYRVGSDCPKPLRGHKRSVVAFSVAQPFSGVQEEDAVQDPVIVPGTDVNLIREWELDFCSRPIVDARGKKVWELLICDGTRNLQFSRFYPNNVINSLTLKDALLSLIQKGLPKPEKIRFFRSQMQNIVSKACRELDIQAVPSRRCISLIRWLDERYDTVYSKHPGFQESATPLLQLEQSFPLELPDNLRGDQWAFVQLPLQGVIEEVAAVEEGSSFGSSFPLEILGLELPSNAVIPGVAVASSRATPLAAWTNALELASIQVDRQKKCLVLSTGVSDRWLYAYYRKSRQADQEAEAWEATKKACAGLHFLAVQKTLDSDVCAGFWLLYDGPPSRV